MRGLTLVALCAAVCSAMGAEWLQLDARPELERHMDGVPLEGPYFDCQCSLDMKCLCDKHAELPDSFLEERTSDTFDSFLQEHESDSADKEGDAKKEEPKEEAKEEAKPKVDLNAKAKVDEADETPSNVTSNSTDGPEQVKRNPDLDAARPYFIDPRKTAGSAGCGKPACMKVNVFCASKKKSACQKKGECCLKARREQKFLREQENAAFKEQKAKNFDEFQQVIAADAKLWKRVEKLDLWREKGQIKEQVDDAIKIKSAEYQHKLDQLADAIGKRVAERETLKTWKANKVTYFASRMGQMQAYEKYLDDTKKEIEENRNHAVQSFKENEQRMDDYLAGSEAVLAARETKLAQEEARLQQAISLSKASNDDQAQEDAAFEKDLATRAKDGTGPYPVTTEARDGKLNAGGDPPGQR